MLFDEPTVILANGDAYRVVWIREAVVIVSKVYASSTHKPNKFGDFHFHQGGTKLFRPKSYVKTKSYWKTQREVHPDLNEKFLGRLSHGCLQPG